MFSAYPNHTTHPYTKRIARIPWLETWMILSIMREYLAKSYHWCTPPCEWLYWPLTDVSSIKPESVTFTYALLVKSNQATNSSEMCFPSWKDRYTQHIKMLHNDRLTIYPQAVDPQTHSFPTLGRKTPTVYLPFFLRTLLIPYSTSIWQPHAIGISPPSSLSSLDVPVYCELVLIEVLARCFRNVYCFLSLQASWRL